ncbi:MAG: Glu/Leu/Phe/Val dehydrogenase dimerization domain-containing protein, partial [Pseudomonadota bacterium]
MPSEPGATPTTSILPPLAHAAFDGHEQVLFCHDARAGLSAIIAVHDTTLGAAAGGCRMYPYANAEAALTDALRLSQGMTYKNALAGLALGGGKAVIIADPAAANKDEVLRAFAFHVQSLGGRYWTAIDVGVGARDVATMGEVTDYVFTLVDESKGRPDTAVFTALGGFVGLEATARYALKRETLEGVRVAVQGVGQTGMDLCRQLHDAGATLIVSDVNETAVAQAVATYGATAVAPDAIYDVDADVFAPCAMGAILNERTVPRLKVKAIAGLANNQLARPEDGDALAAHGILYAPDYVINAGGVMYATDDIFGENDVARAKRRIDGIADTLRAIFDRATTEQRSTAALADDMARALRVNQRAG